MTEFVWLIVVTAVALQRVCAPDRAVISRHRHLPALHPTAREFACGFFRGRSSECCLGRSPIQDEKLSPDRKVLGSATLRQGGLPASAKIVKALARPVMSAKP